MKVAIVYNRDSKSVINLFGVPNREKYGLKSIQRIVASLESGGHQVIALEGDKDLVDRLGDFMPRVLKGERPGMVFNLSYGIQGQARYTHVPGILEMVGIPYVGSGPLAHSLALDKVVAKMIFQAHGVPTPEFAVLQEPGFDAPDLQYPLIVKPKNEAVSFGIQIVNDEAELRTAADVIFDKFAQPVLAERYIEGREINVGLLGNNPPEALPAAELLFGKDGPQIYTYEDKTRKSGREVGVQCPADIPEELAARARKIAQDAFSSLGCYDCARVDMRVDGEGNIYVLEINSLPSLGEHGSYVQGAEAVGLDFAGLVNRLVEVAAARYFGTPKPPDLLGSKESTRDRVFGFITGRRDRIEKRLSEWTGIASRSSDPIGLQTAAREVADTMKSLGLKPVKEFTNDLSTWTYQTNKGLEGGTLFVVHIDVPLEASAPRQMFRRDAEWLHGEGIGTSRGPMVALESAMSALRHIKKLRHIPTGVLFYSDEGRDARYSGEMIRLAAGKAKRVAVLRPGSLGDKVITRRRGQKMFRLHVEGRPRRPGAPERRPSVFRWTTQRLEEFAALSSSKQFLSISVSHLHTRAHPMLLPHQVEATLLLTYADPKLAEATAEKMRQILGKKGHKWELDLLSNRPPMTERQINKRLFRSLEKVALSWEIPLAREASVWPSVAGLVPSASSVVCGIGPVAANLNTPEEKIQRISLIQRTLLLTEFLAGELDE